MWMIGRLLQRLFCRGRYDRLTRLFFGEQHSIRSIWVINKTDDAAEKHIRVHWQSSWREAPAATSKRIDAAVKQR
jgi:hypothetical protein